MQMNAEHAVNKIELFRVERALAECDRTLQYEGIGPIKASAIADLRTHLMSRHNALSKECELHAAR